MGFQMFHGDLRRLQAWHPALFTVTQWHCGPCGCVTSSLRASEARGHRDSQCPAVTVTGTVGPGQVLPRRTGSHGPAHSAGD